MRRKILIHLITFLLLQIKLARKLEEGIAKENI